MQANNLIISDIDFARLLAINPPDELREELERAIVVPFDSMPPDVIAMGSRVQYCDNETGHQREIEIVFPEEADPARGRVSVLAPVGAALIGLAVGQEIDWPFPDGSARCLTVFAVTQAATSQQH